jgi:AcrR family transcriptional regulator
MLIVDEDGIDAATVQQIVARAGISRKTFYEIFLDRSDCLTCAFEEGVAAAGERAREAYQDTDGWPNSIRAGLFALLEFFHENPRLVRLCVLEGGAVGSLAMAHEAKALKTLAGVVDEGRSLARQELPPLAAEGVVGGALSLVRTHIRNVDAGPLTGLLVPLMAFVVLPYLGAAGVRRELRHNSPPPSPPPLEEAMRNPLQRRRISITYRTMRVLAAIGDRPGGSNVEVSRGAGLVDQGQTSKLLSRLAGLGLIVNTSRGRPKGVPNCWYLTDDGEILDANLKRTEIESR